MNVVVLQGTLSSAPRERALPSGTVLMTWEVTTDDAGGKSSVPVCWFDPPASVRGLAEGAAVVVSGHVRRRFYRAGPATVSRTEVVADRGTATGRRRLVERILDQAIDELAPSR